MGRLTLTLIMTFSLTGFIKVVEKYIYADWDFLRFLVVLIIIDTILGLWKSYIKKNISSRGWGQVIKKLITYATLLILTHVLSGYTVGGTVNLIFGWFPQFAYSAIIVKEGISIVENIGLINPSLVPTRILDKLKDFDVKGKFDSDK